MLLHGGSGSWMHWLRNVEALAAAGRRVLVPDLPGFGDSALPPGNPDADGVAEALAQGLPALVGEQAVDVAGFSFGGLSAGLLAALQPQLVRSLVLVGAPGLGLRDRRLPLTAWRHLADPQAVRAAHRSNLKTLMLWREDAIDELAVSLQAANVPLDRMPRRRPRHERHPGAQAAASALHGRRDLWRDGCALRRQSAATAGRAAGLRRARAGADPRGRPLGAVRAAGGFQRSLALRLL